MHSAARLSLLLGVLSSLRSPPLQYGRCSKTSFDVGQDSKPGSLSGFEPTPGSLSGLGEGIRDAGLSPTDARSVIERADDYFGPIAVTPPPLLGSRRQIGVSMDSDLLDAICDLVADLARGRLAEIEADGRAGRLSASELLSAIRDYGRTLVPLPDEAVHLIDVYLNDWDSTKSSLDVPLWTIEEGRSDLTLSLVATKDGDKYRVEISDLHVL